MPCYFCAQEKSNLKKCPNCLQLYCEDHHEGNLHDCPLVPIQNPYELKAGAGNQLVSPEELSTELSTTTDLGYITPSHSPTQTATESSYYEQQKALHDAQMNSSSLSSSSSISDDEETYIYTDGSYVWRRKGKGEIPEDAFNPESGVTIPGLLWPAKSEIFHIFVASILLFILAATGFYSQYMGIDSMPLDEKIISIVVLSLLYLMAFLIHEFSHRQVAVHFKLQTKFRLFKMGVIMTAVCLFLPIKMALPGAVVVIGLEKIGKETGLCKLAGPLSNLILGCLLLILSFVPFIYYPWNLLLLQGASFNFMLGSFNMLPIGILDGDNIRKWKPKIWILFFIILVTLFITVMILLSNTYITYEFFYRGTDMPWRDYF